MYKSFYHLTENPFSLNPDPHFLFPSKQHKNAFKYLMYALENREGLIELVGEVGCGKTLLSRVIISTLGEDTKTALILNPPSSQTELLENIMADLGLPISDKSQKELLQDMLSFLIEEYTQGRNVVVFIDEAQDMNLELLKAVHFLSNMETNKKKLIQIVLVGQPELEVRLRNPELKQLDQKISTRCTLGPISKKEAENYIYHRLKLVGTEEIKFTTSAVNKIYRFSKGIPRLINLTCDKALVAGFFLKQTTIDGKTVDKALRTTQKRWQKYAWQEMLSPLHVAFAFSVVGIIMLVSINWYYQNKLAAWKRQSTPNIRVINATVKNRLHLPPEPAKASGKTKKALSPAPKASDKTIKLGEKQKKKIAAARKILVQLAKERKDKQRELAKGKKLLASLAKDKEAKDRELSKIQKMLTKLNKDKKAKDQAIAKAKKTLDLLTKDKKTKQTEIAKEKKALEKIVKDKKTKDVELAKVQKVLAKLAEARKAKDQELAKLQSNLKKMTEEKKAQERKLAKEKKSLKELLKDKKTKQAEIAKEKKALEKLVKEKKAKTLELAVAKKKLEELNKNKKDKKQELAGIKKLLIKLSNDKKTKDLAVAKAKKTLAKLIADRKAKDKELAGLEKSLLRLAKEKKEQNQQLAEEKKVLEKLTQAKKAKNIEIAKAEKILKKLGQDKKAKDLELAGAQKVLRQLTKERIAKERQLAEQKKALEKLTQAKKAKDLEIAKAEKILKKLGQDKKTKDLELAGAQKVLQKLTKERIAKERQLARDNKTLEELAKDKKHKELEIANAKRTLEILAKDKRIKELEVINEKKSLEVLAKEKKYKELELAYLKQNMAQLTKEKTTRQLTRRQDLFEERTRLVAQRYFPEATALQKLLKVWDLNVTSKDAAAWPGRGNSLDFKSIAGRYGLDAIVLDTDFREIAALNLPCIMFPASNGADIIPSAGLLYKLSGNRAYFQNKIYPVAKLAPWRGKALILWKNTDNLTSKSIPLNKNSQELKRVTHRLRQLGYLPRVRVNTRQVEHALMTFQKDHSLPKKPVIGTQTKLALYRIINQPLTPTLAREFVQNKKEARK